MPDQLSGVVAPSTRSARALVVVWATLWSCLVPAALAGQSWSTMRAFRERLDETGLDVLVRYGVGEFTVSAASPPRLYEVLLRYDEESFDVLHRFEAGRLSVGIEGNGGPSVFNRGASRGGLDLTLSREVPIDLDLEFGAVRADLDLGGLRLSELSLSTGASEAELRVSEPNPERMGLVSLAIGAASFRARELGNLRCERFEIEAGVGDVRLDFSGLELEETHVQAEMGLGNLELRIPSDAGIRLTRESFLTSLDAPELEQRGDVYYSSNWDSSTIRITIDVEAAFGRVSVLRAD